MLHTQKKHAYLIMAHEQFEVLKKFLVLLDDEKNDFYIHIDKKTKKFPEKEISSSVKYSKVFFVPRISVNWGGYSFVQCEMSLLSEAMRENYMYYHLVSGADFPIKTVEEINKFFEENQGKEFVQFEKKEFQEKFKDRISLYHYFREGQGRSAALRLMENLSIKWQEKKKVDRTANLKGNLQKGSNWFSITNEFAHYLISKKEEIEQIFQNTSCSDEIFLQTMLINSPFKDKLYDENFNDSPRANMRFIDWKRGAPYVFRTADFEELIQSEYLFARKFDEKVDEEIINQLFEYLMKKRTEEHAI